MENAAHAESLDHEVYRTPLTVQPEFEYRATPQNYRLSYFGPGKLPDKIKIWRVQTSQRGNVVARGYGFEDSPDAEILAVGFNHGKAYGDVGIGRQANVLQWGYCDPPSQMTEAGRRLFVNCIHYIRRFDGKTPLVRPQNSGRENALLSASYLKILKEKEKFFHRVFPAELWGKYQSDFDGLLAYYQQNLELVYWDKVYRVDNELQSLGLGSNRKLESLEHLIALLDDAGQANTARELLARYTEMAFETPQQWRQWFTENRQRIYFTDVGGYKFKVVPEGYLAAK
jgi:hypothetical protein